MQGAANITSSVCRHDLLPGFNRPKQLTLDKPIWKSICVVFCEFEFSMMDLTLSLDHLVDMARGRLALQSHLLYMQCRLRISPCCQVRKTIAITLE